MIFTDQEKVYIKAFVENAPMFEAVRKVLLPDEEFASGIPIADDAEYGRAVRAWVGARDLVRNRFNDLKRIASGNPQPNVGNGAR
jgi:hypothetical protein